MVHELFQSTRPHGARHADSYNLRKQLFVSIHAPAWGATPNDVNGMGAEQVSIHAPAWGATFLGHLVKHYVESFNPRARMGRDLHTFPGY